MIVLMDNSFKKTHVLLVKQIVLYVIILLNLTVMFVKILLLPGMVKLVLLLLLVLNAWRNVILVLMLLLVINVLLDLSGIIQNGSA